MTYTCSDLPFTAAYHHDLTDMISPGQAAVLPGYAGGRKRKRNKTRKKSKNKTRKNKYIKKKNRRGGYITQAQQKAFNPKLAEASNNARANKDLIRENAEKRRKEKALKAEKAFKEAQGKEEKEKQAKEDLSKLFDFNPAPEPPSIFEGFEINSESKPQEPRGPPPPTPQEPMGPPPPTPQEPTGPPPPTPQEPESSEENVFFAPRISHIVDQKISEKKKKLKENLDLIRNDILNDYTKNVGSIEYIKNILNEDIYNESEIESIKDFDALNKIIEKIKNKFLFPEDENIKLVTKENLLKYFLSLYELDNFTTTCVKCKYDNNNNKVMKNNKSFFDIQTQGSVKGFINKIYRNVNKKFKLLQKDLDNEIKDIKNNDFHVFIENKLSEIFNSIPDYNDYLDLIIKIIDSNKSKISSNNIDKVHNYLVKLGDKYRELLNKETQKSNPIQFKMTERPRAWAHDQNIKQMETVKKSEPVQEPVTNKKGFFGKIKGFFSGGRKITRKKRNKRNKTRKNRTRKYRTKRNKTKTNTKRRNQTKRKKTKTNTKRRNQTKRKKNRTMRRS